MTTAAILDWAAAREAGVAGAGGKGWQLARMAHLGVPVPPGFVLAASASLARRPGEPVADTLAQALHEALRQRGWLDLPLALRSSSPQEDARTASFAGIHLSCLNVRGAAAAVDAVRHIWDSAWSPQADAYRQRLGLQAEERPMAVVVMPLLPATSSGIAFTCDPLGGRLDGQDFWIVQARPVTAMARHTYPGLQSQPSYWSRGNTREVLPLPMSALEWDGGRLMAERMLTRGFELSGYRTLPGARLAAMFDGRVYLDASVIQWVGHDALGIAPSAMNALLGGPQPEIQVPAPGLAQRWRHALRMLRYLRRAGPLRRRADADLPRQFARARAWLDETPPADSAALGARLLEQFRTVAAADDLFFLQGSGGGALSKLLEWVERARPGQGHALTAALMAGGEPSVTAAQSYDLMALAQRAAREPHTLAWLREPGRDGAAWARRLPPDSAFHKALAEFLGRYGHRAVYETYLRNPRWREAPDYLLDSVLNLIGADPAALRARQERAARQAWHAVRAALPWWQRPLAAKLLAAARREGAQREAARSVLVAYLAAARRSALELGTRMRGADGLAAADDIFHLTAEEIFALAAGRLAPAAAARRAADRRARLAAWAEAPDRDVIVEYGEAPPVVAPAAPVGGNGSWRGTPVASGRAQGPAFVAQDPHAALAMPAGAILVAPSTDPAWTPLFLRAGAVVMEAGGYLSHGAIVAREFGIPAVVNVQGILRQVASGDWLEVDAARGTVRRLPAPAGAATPDGGPPRPRQP